MRGQSRRLSGRNRHTAVSAFAAPGLRVERKTIIRLRNERVINDDALRRIQRDLDLAEARLTGG
jgi:hypothetical protein